MSMHTLWKTSLKNSVIILAGFIVPALGVMIIILIKFDGDPLKETWQKLTGRTMPIDSIINMSVERLMDAAQLVKLHQTPGHRLPSLTSVMVTENFDRFAVETAETDPHSTGASVKNNSKKSLSLWDINGPTQLASISSYQSAWCNFWPMVAAFSPDGTLFAAGGQDNTLRVYDAVSGQAKREITGHSGLIHTVVFSPDGRLIVSGAEDNTLRIGEAMSGKAVRQFKFPTAYQISFSPDGKLLAAMAWQTGFDVWNVETGNMIMHYGKPEIKCDSINFAFSPDSKNIALALLGHSVKLFNIATGRQEREIKTPQTVYALAYRNDGKILALGMGGCGVELWNLIEGKPVLTLLDERQTRSDVILSVRFSKDDKKLLLANTDEFLIVDVDPEHYPKLII